MGRRLAEGIIKGELKGGGVAKVRVGRWREGAGMLILRLHRLLEHSGVRV